MNASPLEVVTVGRYEMKSEDALRMIPQHGFLKIRRTPPAPLSSEQKAALIRKGNELFNAGRVEEARRIFVTTGYGDGLSRVGDRYYAARDPLEAFRMYWIAPSPPKVESMLEKMAHIVKHWLREDRDADDKKIDGRDGNP